MRPVLKRLGDEKSYDIQIENLTLPTYTDRESASSFSACVAEVLDESSYMLKGTHVSYKDL